MNKANAVITIIRDARVERSTKTSYKRVLKALEMLELTSHDRIQVLVYLDYVHPDTRLLYEQYQ